MKASIATTLCMLSLSMAICQAESTTIDLMTGSPTTKEVSTKPEISVEESGDTLTVSLNFHYARLTSQEGIEGSSIEIDGFSRNTVPGEAEWLLRNVNHPFEEGQFPSIELIGHEFIEMPMKLTLARNQSIDNAMNVSLQSMVNKYASNRYLPESPITPTDACYYRGHGFVPVQISPVQYNPSTEMVRISQSITYRVVLSSGMTKIAGKSDNPMKLQLSSDDDFMSNIVPDYLKQSRLCTKAISQDNGLLLPGGEKYGYLILTVPELQSAAQKLASWKRMLGYDISIYPKAPGVNQPWTPEAIKRIIKMQASQSEMLYYVLILGDHNQLPGVQYPHPHPYCEHYMISDFQYSCLDGDDDDVPDLYIGRIPLSNLTDAMNAVDKIIEYEKNPPLDSKFYNSAFFFAEFEGYENTQGMEKETFVYSSEFIRKAIENGSTCKPKALYRCKLGVDPLCWNSTFARDLNIPEYLRKPNYPWTVEADDIINAFNSGSLFGMYRGHSGWSIWGNQLWFDMATEIDNINNPGRYPVIFNISCMSGCYDRHDDCVASVLLRKKRAGAAGVIAASAVSYSPQNDTFAAAMMNCFYPNCSIGLFHNGYVSLTNAGYDALSTAIGKNNHTLGKAMVAGMQVLSSCTNSRDTLLPITKKVFHCFGDPSMSLKTKVPINRPDVKVTPVSDGFMIQGNSSSYAHAVYVTVIDTLRSRILAHQLLTDCKIQTSYPKRCKVVISGYDLRPLIIDGAKGYSLWETLNKPKAEEDDEEDDGIGRWLFEAFNYTPPYKRYWSPIPGCLTYNEIKVADDARDLEFFGAFVYRSDLHPDCESYTLMPSFDGDSPTEMGCPWFGWQTYIVRKDLKVPNPRCQIIDGDYFELSDIDIIPNGIYQTDIHNDKHRIVSGTYEPIKPYSGWWPEMDEMIKPNETIAGYFDFCPFQYNYETRTVRFYTRLRLQFSEQSDVSSIYEDEDSPVFYTVDGRLEPNPQHGKIYLRKSSKGFDKILF